MKRYYDRKEELQTLAEEMSLVKANARSRLAVITGRRRVGKTELILHAAQNSDVPFIYLFCARVSQKQLIEDWLRAIKTELGITFAPHCERLSQVVDFLLFLGKDRRINIAIDECQDINAIEPSFWSEVQKFWDMQKKNSQLFLILSGSIASAMRNIFQAYSEPLYGRVDRGIHVRPFGNYVLQEIIKDKSAESGAEELLALYALTGGVAWFVEDLMERSAFSLQSMADAAFAPGSIFISDGDILLANEFRADANVNRTILQAIASGITKRDELQNLVGPTQISGALSRLESQFEMISKNSPLLEPNYRKVRYKMTDRYLMFWFSFVQGNQSLLERGNFKAAREDFLARYETFSGRALEQCFLEKLKASSRFSLVGSWWDRKGENEIDLIAQDAKALYFFEIKRNPKKINIEKLRLKAHAFLERHAELKDNEIVFRGLSLEDLVKSVDEICCGYA